MATPVSRAQSPVPDTLQCAVCNRAINNGRCPDHALCSDCCDAFCPLCLRQLAPLERVLHFFQPSHGSQFFETQGVCLELIFVYTFLLDIRVTKAAINCRLQCRWAGTEFTVLVYRNRAPYSGLRTVLPRQRGSSLEVCVVPPSLDAPKLPGTLCSWRFFLEMYAFALDRPECRHLHLLPDSVVSFLETYTLQPQKAYQLWQFEHKFAKYGVFFFATEKNFAHVVCVQCGRTFSTLEQLHEQCLGGFLLADLDTVYQAQPITIHFCDGVLLKELQAGETFAKHVQKLANPRSGPKIQGPLSLLCFISLHPDVTVVPASAAKHLHFLLAKCGLTIPKFFCYDLQVNNIGLLQGFHCWLCWGAAIAVMQQMEIKVITTLDKFTSCLHLALYRTITRQGIKMPTSWGTLFSWREFQAISYLP